MSHLHRLLLLLFKHIKGLHCNSGILYELFASSGVLSAPVTRLYFCFSYLIVRPSPICPYCNFPSMRLAAWHSFKNVIFKCQTFNTTDWVKVFWKFSIFFRLRNTCMKFFSTYLPKLWFTTILLIMKPFKLRTLLSVLDGIEFEFWSLALLYITLLYIKRFILLSSLFTYFFFLLVKISGIVRSHTLLGTNTSCFYLSMYGTSMWTQSMCIVAPPFRIPSIVCSVLPRSAAVAAEIIQKNWLVC